MKFLELTFLGGINPYVCCFYCVRRNRRADMSAAAVLCFCMHYIIKSWRGRNEVKPTEQKSCAYIIYDINCPINL